MQSSVLNFKNFIDLLLICYNTILRFLCFFDEDIGVDWIIMISCITIFSNCYTYSLLLLVLLLYCIHFVVSSCCCYASLEKTYSGAIVSNSASEVKDVYPIVESMIRIWWLLVMLHLVIGCYFYMIIHFHTSMWNDYPFSYYKCNNIVGQKYFLPEVHWQNALSDKFELVWY